jgi:HK97 gp10 family phage protein
MSNNARREADRVTERTARSIVASAQVAMSEPKSGKVYVRGNVAHQASAPGEAPAVDTGVLRASGGVEPAGDRDGWWAYFSAEYGLYLEYGTPTIEPRPFLRPAVEQHRDEYLDEIARLVGR